MQYVVQREANVKLDNVKLDNVKMGQREDGTTWRYSEKLIKTINTRQIRQMILNIT
jgi:hypothetical protein